ncbi:MAG: cysteine desulfurase [Thermoplasmata archaeon]|nr:cysteine desulfurase [Thermoplasmata archaeon]
MDKEKGVYLDYQAGAGVDPRVLDVMLPYMTESFGNPTSMHHWSWEAKKALENARRAVADLLGSQDWERILFTSSATESNNLALKGTARRLKKKGMHIVTSNIEHWSVHTPLKALQKEGFEVTQVEVDEQGLVDPGDVESAIRDDTIVISIMMANNEIGAIQPLEKIAHLAHERNALFHTDATAALGRMGLDVEKMGIDLLSLSSNQIYGPRGVGALYVKKGIRLEPVLHGGGQEFGMRSGTENIPGIVGLGKAAWIMAMEGEEERRMLGAMSDNLIERILSTIPGASLNGPKDPRLPGNVNVRFSYVEGEALVLGLDSYGIATSSGSACSSKTLEPSHVLLAIGLPHEIAHGSLQLSFGRWTTQGHMEKLMSALPKVVERLQKMSPLAPPEWLKEMYGG